MSGRSVKDCHKTRIENCKGSLLEPKSNYIKWAYWCVNRTSGWHSTPCTCNKK